MKYVLSLFLFVCVLFPKAYAGEQPKAAVKTVIVSGKIQDLKSSETLAGVRIECGLCDKVIYSDLEGHFFLYIKVEGTQKVQLEFTQVGYATKTLDLQDLSAQTSNLQVVLEAE